MAITNKAIIDAYKTANGLSLDTPLYTWAVWHNMGYRVRKGEKSLHKVVLHKHRAARLIKNDNDETAESKPSCFITKTCYLFAENQVEKIGG